MRVFRLGLLSSFTIVALMAAFSHEILGQDERMIGGGSGITVFVNRNFRGDAVTYQGNMSNLPSSFNNRISSIRVGPGEQWQICDQPNYRGQCVNVSGEESDLRRNNWDNKISSLRRIGGGFPGNPGVGNRPPSWLVGTWYWTRGDRRMVISSNGNITVNNQGRPGRGNYRNGTLVFDGVVSNVSQIGGGIRTYNTQSGEISDYTRWQGGGGETSRPPSWAIGNWRWIQGSGRTMSISVNGEVVVVNQGRYSRGTYHNGVITLDGITSSLARRGRGRIRTVNRSSGEISDYIRN